MARFEVSGIEAAQEAFLRRSERAAKAVPKMLKAGGAVLVKAEQEEIRRTFTSNRVTGDLANSIKCTAVKKRGSGAMRGSVPGTGKTDAGSGTQPLVLSTNTGEAICPRARGSRVRTRRQRRKFRRLCGRHGRTNRNDRHS